jgi:hypothetical protein
MFWKVLGKRRMKASSANWVDIVQATTRAWGLRISGWLQRKTMTFSPVRLKLYAVLFLLLFGTWNGWIIYHALQQPRSPIPTRQVSLSRPTIPTIRAPVDPSSLAGIEQFQSWLDSLQKDSAGQRIYDTILRQRPGLLDSLRKLERSNTPTPFN